MLLRRIAFQMIFLALVSLATHAQAFKSLTYIDKVPVPHNEVNGSFAIRLPTKCGPDGTIYVRFAGMDREPALNLIRQDGKLASSIRLNEVHELWENHLDDFAPGDGEVFVLSKRGKRHAPTTYYISRFKIDGTYVSSAKLDTDFRPDFEPKQIAAFPSGELLIAGMAKGHDVPFVPFTAIFGANGEFQREVGLKSDVNEKHAKGEPSNAGLSPAEQMQYLLDVTYLQTADDGNIYLMRHTPSGPVFVVSPGGSVRKVALVPPIEGAVLQWIMSSQGSIAAHYISVDAKKGKTHYLTIVDAWTGKSRETIQYKHDYQTNGSGMVCYRNGAFTFLAGTSDNKVQLVRAIPQ